MSGATSDRIIRRKITESGLSVTATPGASHPTRIPSSIAMRIHRVSESRGTRTKNRLRCSALGADDSGVARGVCIAAAYNAAYTLIAEAVRMRQQGPDRQRPRRLGLHIREPKEHADPFEDLRLGNIERAGGSVLQHRP